MKFVGRCGGWGVAEESGEDVVVDFAADAEMDFVAEFLLDDVEAGFVVLERDGELGRFGDAKLGEAGCEDVLAGHRVLGLSLELVAELEEPFSGAIDPELALPDAGLEVVDLEGDAVFYQRYSVGSDLVVGNV